MGKNKPTKDIKENVKEVAVEEAEDFIGVPIDEERDSASYKGAIKIPLGYIRKAKVDGEDCEVVLRWNVPPKIEPDKYYAACEWRINHDDLDNADNWPQWKRLPLLINKTVAMDAGRAVMVTYYVIVSIQEVPETNPHERHSPFKDFAVTPPFSNDKIQMSDFDLPVIKGSDIIAVGDAKKVLSGDPGFGAIRRRGQDTSR